MASLDATSTARLCDVSNEGLKFQMYEHLQRNEIRLAEVKASTHDNDNDEEVVCHLRTVLRDSALTYNALSYCWGPPEERGKASIIIESRSKTVRWPVTPTLEMALRRLRHKDGHTPLLIWADALCINQDDEVEKGYQVQEMRHVYQNAEEVSIWLGPADEDSAIAWSLMDSISSHGSDSVELQLFNEAQFRAMQNLFWRPYFWRIWIIQEIACAKNATVYCGPQSMPWSRLLHVSEILDQIMAKARDQHYEHESAVVFLMMRGGPGTLKATASSIFSVRERQPQPLLDLLCSHMLKGSTDPRDKVYGLVGISADQSRFGKISYERSTRDTFIYTAQYIISATQKLNVICLKQNNDNILNLPSWVADWERRDIFPQHFGPKPLYIRQPVFTASLNAKASFHFSTDGEVLTTRGFLLDTVTTIGQEFQDIGPRTGAEPEVRASLGLRAFHNWWTVFINEIGAEHHEVFQRAFCGGAWAPPESEFERDISFRLAFFFGLIDKLLPELEIDKSLLTFLPDVDSTIEAAVLEARQYALVFSASRRMHNKRFVVSSTKLAGLAPQAAREGDHIVVLFGCDTPVVMRDMGSHWTLIGEIYIDGIMYGEAMDGLMFGKYIEKEFEIH